MTSLCLTLVSLKLIPLKELIKRNRLVGNINLSIHYSIVSSGRDLRAKSAETALLGNIRFTRQVGAAGTATKRNYLKFQRNRKHWLAGERNRTSREHTGRAETEQEG